MGRRVDNWRYILGNVIAENNKTPFEWGVFDCCLFPAKCVDAMTGSTIEATLNERYSDKVSALRLIADADGIANLAPEFLPKEISANYVSDGDVCLVMQNETESLAIFHKGKAIATGKNGLVRLPRSVIIKGWRV